MKLARQLALAATVVAAGSSAIAQNNSPEGIQRFANEIDAKLEDKCPIPTADTTYPAEVIECARETVLWSFEIANRAFEEAEPRTPVTFNAARLVQCDTQAEALYNERPSNGQMSDYVSRVYNTAVLCMQGTDTLDAWVPGVNYNAAQNVIIDQLNCWTNPEDCQRPNALLDGTWRRDI